MNYSAQQHVERKVPSVAKYVHMYSMNILLQGHFFFSMSLGGGIDQSLLEALEAAYKDVSLPYSIYA